MTLNIGIIGCGKIADGHLDEIEKLGCARVVAVCDLDPVLTEQLALRYSGSHWPSDFDRMFSERRLNVIHITSPPYSHLALAQKSAEAVVVVGAHGRTVGQVYTSSRRSSHRTRRRDWGKEIGSTTRNCTLSGGASWYPPAKVYEGRSRRYERNWTGPQ